MTERLPSTETTERTRGRRWIARIGALLAAMVLAPILALVTPVSPARADHEADGHTPFCEAGKTPDFSFRDDMENPASGNWSFAHSEGPTDWRYGPGRPNHGDTNTGPDKPKGPTSLVAPDLEVISDHTVTRTGTVSPAAGTPTYVRFTHFGWSINIGTIMEYSINGGPWKNVTDKGTGATLFDQNPYAGIIPEDDIFPGPLMGEPGWVFDDYSWNWEVSRLNLSSLVGQNVGIRFRHSTSINGSDGEDAFYVDDYSVYTCVPLARVNAPTKVTATAANRSATVTWTPPVTQGNLPITGYRVTPFANGAPMPGWEQWLDETDTSTKFRALQNGTTYTFTVTAEVEGGMGPTSAASNAVVPMLPTTTGSMVFIKNNNVWLSGPYGENPRQLTTDGTANVPYASPSQSDDGTTIVAVRNENLTATNEHKQGRVFVMNRDGSVRTSFVPPGQFEPAVGDGGCNGVLAQSANGIGTINISPDGTKLAYSAKATVFKRTSVHPFCRTNELGKTFISNLDGTNPAQLVAPDGKSDFKYPSWVGNTRVITRFGLPPVPFTPNPETDPAMYFYTVGGSVALWYTQATFLGSVPPGDPSMRASKLAVIDFNDMEVWRTNGGPPTLPTQACLVEGATATAPWWATSAVPRGRPTPPSWPGPRRRTSPTLRMRASTSALWANSPAGTSVPATTPASW